MANILVVDDNDEIRSTLKEFLEEEGYTVRVASDGDEALRSLDQYPADLIVLADSGIGPKPQALGHRLGLQR